MNNNLTVNKIATLCENNSDLIAKVSHELGLADDLGWFTNCQWIAQEFNGVDDQEFHLRQIISSVR